MTDRVRQLLESLDRNRRDIRALLLIVSSHDLRLATDSGWSVGELAAHIVQIPRANLYVVAHLRFGTNATPPGLPSVVTDIGNYLAVRQLRHASLDELIAALDQEHRALADEVSMLSDVELDRGGRVMALGRVTTEAYLRQTPAHSAHHAASLRRALRVNVRWR